MKRFLSILSLAALTIGLLVSCNTPNPVGPITFGMAEILATNPDIPVGDDQENPPADAWVNSSDPGCKAFILDGEIKTFFVYNYNPSIGLGFGFSNDEFTKVDENTYNLEDEDGVYIIHMTAGKFTSFEYQPTPGNRYESLGGTYSPSQK